MSHKRTHGERVGNIQFGYRLGADGKHLEPDTAEQEVLDPPYAPERPHAARDYGGAEPSGAPNPPRFCLAAGARGPDH